MYRSLQTFSTDNNTVVVHGIDYQEAKNRREDLRSANASKVILPEHQIITTDDEAHEDIFVGSSKPWEAVVDVFFTGTPNHEDGRAYARCTAIEDGLTYEWAVRFEFCQSHGGLFLDVLPASVRARLVENMQSCADSQESYARRMEDEAREAREKSSNIRRLYRQD